MFKFVSVRWLCGCICANPVLQKCKNILKVLIWAVCVSMCVHEFGSLRMFSQNSCCECMCVSTRTCVFVRQNVYTWEIVWFSTCLCRLGVFTVLQQSSHAVSLHVCVCLCTRLALWYCQSAPMLSPIMLWSCPMVHCSHPGFSACWEEGGSWEVIGSK